METLTNFSLVLKLCRARVRVEGERSREIHLITAFEKRLGHSRDAAGCCHFVIVSLTFRVGHLEGA